MKRRRNVRRRNSTAPSCPAPNRWRRVGGAEMSLSLSYETFWAMYGSHSRMPLNGLQNQGFLEVFEILLYVGFFKFSPRNHKNQKSPVARKMS